MENEELEMLALYHKARECYQHKGEQEEAFLFLRAAAEKNMVDACKLLGIVYLSGQYAPYPDKDEEQAALWYRKAAELGDEEAMWWLSQCYEMGIGVGVNEQEAERWRQLAREHGFVPEEPEEEPETDEPEEQTRRTADEEPAKPEKQVEAAEELPEENGAVKLPEAEEAAAPGGAILAEEPGEEELRRANEKRYGQEEEQAQKANAKYRRTLGFGGAGIGFLAALVLGLLAYGLLAEKVVQPLWIGIGALAAAVLAMLLGYALGVKKAQRRLEEVAEYRKTPFYHAFGCELGHMNKQEVWCYRVYQALSRSFYPVTYRAKPDSRRLREYRGLVYPHWIYQAGREKAQPEFVLITRKAVYVVHTHFYTGRFQGDLHDPQWSLYADGAQDLTAEKVSNLADKNEECRAVVKAELEQRSGLALDEVPFYNVIFLNEEVDIKGLRRVSAPDDLIFIQGGADKLRSQIGLWESRLSMHSVGMDTLMEAFDAIGQRFVKRSGW